MLSLGVIFSKQRRHFSFVPVIIAINIIVFLMWSYFSETNFMQENFLISWEALEEMRYWTLITSVFSHNLMWHIFLNMFVLNSFGRVVEDTLGSWRFIRFYFVAGVVSSLVHAAVSNFLMNAPEWPALGASGAISGVVLFFSLMYRKEKVLIFGIIPMPALWGALAFVSLDLWGLYAQAGGGGLPIGHGAHLGGAFAGVLYYFMVRKKPDIFHVR